MATLYVISVEAYSGKSALCLGLGLRFREAGLSLGYMKPLGTDLLDMDGQLVDRDCAFISQILQTDESPLSVCPVLLTPELVVESAERPSPNYERAIREAHDSLAQGHDVVIMEGSASLADGYSLGVPPAHIAQLTAARVVLVVGYAADLFLDEILMAKDLLGDRLVGVVCNSVPATVVSRVKGALGAFLTRHGLRLFGVLPLDRLLMAITVGELADVLRGKILCSADKRGELVESFSVGAMNVDSALRYFMRTPNKAVITGGDRADIQLAALNTSTKCLILTGNLYPDAVILGRAAEAGVPVILVSTDTLTTVGKVEQVMGRIRWSNPQQLERLIQMVRSEVDLAALRQVLGV